MAETPVGPGTILAGRFVLEDLLEETEGARFWRATDRTLARSVAVHVIAAEDHRSEALLNAARTSATVTDGHLLRVLDAATEDGVTYVVNEWGHGTSLDQLLVEGPLPARRAAWVVKEVAEAISSAHRHGIAHGRLLPENVMVTEAGSVKLIGFVVDAVIRGRVQARASGGRSLDEHEADVVNLAALLYAALVGKWPGTEGSTLPDAPTEHGRPLRPRQVRAGVPRPLDAICDRVLNGDSDSRSTPLETAHEIYAALSDFIGDPGAAAPVGFEATSFFDEEELATLRGDVRPDADADAGATGEHGGLEELVATQAGASVFYEDPEATQISAAPRPTRSPAPEPPPLPERPLFASESPRPPRTSGGAARPASGWAPEDRPVVRPPGRDTAGFDAAAPGRSWLRLALAIGGVLLLVVAIIVAFNLGQGSGTGEPDGSTPPDVSSGPAEPVEIVAVSDFDPQGDPQEENPETAPLAADGDPSSAWRTSTYFDPISMLKDGVGLLVDLGGPTEVSEVSVTFVGSPTSFELLAAPDGDAAPTSTDGLTRVGRQARAGTQSDVTLAEPVTTQYLVVWLTELPSADGGFRGQVAEVVVR